MTAALCVGIGLGLLNGCLTRVSLRWAMGGSDKLFYGVWAAGFLYRFLFAVAMVFMLIRHPVLPILPTLLALIVGQFIPQVVPLRRASWT